MMMKTLLKHLRLRRFIKSSTKLLRLIFFARKQNWFKTGFVTLGVLFLPDRQS